MSALQIICSKKRKSSGFRGRPKVENVDCFFARRSHLLPPVGRFAACSEAHVEGGESSRLSEVWLCLFATWPHCCVRCPKMLFDTIGTFTGASRSVGKKATCNGEATFSTFFINEDELAEKMAMTNVTGYRRLRHKMFKALGQHIAAIASPGPEQAKR